MKSSTKSQENRNSLFFKFRLYKKQHVSFIFIVILENNDFYYHLKNKKGLKMDEPELGESVSNQREESKLP